MPDIQINGLTKQFGSTQVLKGLDLTVRDGEFLTLLGSSGCGKSTLLRLIAGLDQPDAGAIRLGERDLLQLSPSQRDCAMVFQTYALYPHMTVGENICTPLLMRGLNFWQRLPGMRWLSPAVRRKHAEAETSARKVAQSLGMDGLWERKSAQLSGGQRQRVALARAMVRHPSVFLFDEPLSNLDANLRQALRAEIRQLHDQLGVTFIYVTHDQHEAMSMSDRVAVMREGCVLQLGTPDEIYNQPAHVEVARFVGAPRINLLPGEIRGNSVWALGRQIGHVPQGQDGGVCQIGFRPQMGTLATANGLEIHGRITGVEYTGAELIATVQLAMSEQSCVFCLHSSHPDLHIGETLRTWVSLDQIHVFAADGQRLAFHPQPVLLDAAA
ncbi:MAG: ABC transporter [Curvibacter sp. GWA2_64_110]|nr:MAG: ABC transporter [Curvibacter sp. GWA2_64_110]HCY15184.1 ABC transporter ATP-binding protein [Curvibacter sp.]